MKRKRLAIIAIIITVTAASGASYALFQKEPHTPPSQKTQKKQTSKPSKETPDQPAQPQEPKAQPAKTTPPAFNKSQYSLDDPASIWVVANKARPLQPKSYAPTDLVSVGNGQRLRSEAAQALSNLVRGAKSAGYTIRPLSGYRSYSTQVSVYNNEVRVNGQAVADTQSARPGTSEHQTGLSIDVGGGGCGIEDCFGNTAEGKWLAANAYRHGFIIRYPEGKIGITGYRYEPWHIRYVGTALSTEMHSTNINTLEEFFGLQAAPQYLN